MNNTIGVYFGALSPPLKEQLKDFNLPSDTIEHYQRDADAVIRLKIRGLLTDSQANSAQKKIVKGIVNDINESMDYGQVSS